MRRLVIAIDCDDVLIPSSSRIIERYNHRFGTTIGLDSMYREGDTWQADSYEAAISRVDMLLRDDRILDDLVPDEKTIRSINLLASAHELHLVTGRQTYMSASTDYLLETYFKGCFTSIEHTNYIASAQSAEVKRSKGDVCEAIKADILVDDHISHGVDVLARGVKRVILFGDYAWNQPDDIADGIVRCFDWDSTVNEINIIANE